MTSRFAPKSKPAYMLEFLLHPWNWYAALSSVATGAILSIPYGWGAGAVPLVAYGASAVVAGLFVPDSKPFREWVDRVRTDEARAKARKHLIDEIVRKVDSNHPLWETYARLNERLESLRKLTESNDTALSRDEIIRLDDATVDFLGLWLGRIAMAERNKALSEKEIAQRIQNVDKQIEVAEDPTDKRRLIKAKDDLEELARRRQEMKTREASAEAAMMSIADTFDEVFQRVTANPNERDAELRGAVDRMNIEEEIDYVLNDEVAEFLGEKKR